ncbi:hypothetical protein [Flavobacterium sp.]
MKQFNVRIWLGSTPTIVMITATNSAQALSVARKLYPTARVVSASTT